MANVEIEYCVPCGLLEPAIDAGHEILEEFGRDLDSIQLTPGGGGVFQLYVNGDIVFDRTNHGGEIDMQAILEEVDERVSQEV